VCGRFSLNTPADLLAQIFALPIPSELPTRYNIAPTQPTLIIRQSPQAREAATARWGFIAPWRREGEKGPEPINARSESAPSNPLFAQALNSRRCIVPASGFYEWQIIPGEKNKRPHYITPANAPILPLAALWSRWTPTARPAVESFTILTCEPNQRLKPIHNRMPVILPLTAIDAWLDPAINHAPSIAAMLRPAPEESIVIHQVSPWVNSPAHDDPRCALPVAP